MSVIVVELPAAEDSGPLAWLMARVQADQAACGERIAVRMHDAGGIAVAVADRGVTRSVLAVSGGMLQPRSGPVEIAPGLSLQPESNRLTRFLEEQWRALDHVGINFSHRDLDESTWRAAIAELGALVPAWRLDVGSANDIVFIVLEHSGTANPAVVELVYDRAALSSSVHFCVRVAAARSEVERVFAAPRGGYKAGDEAFFRSVALPALPRLPVYADLAFSDAPLAPWPRTVQAIGRRLG